MRKAKYPWIGFYNEFEGELVRAVKWLGFSNKYLLSKFLVENGLIFLNAGVQNFLREGVGAGDIVSLRKDIFNYLQTKRNSFLMKKFYAKFPFYNRLLKNKLVRKAVRINRGLLNNTPQSKRYGAVEKEMYANILSKVSYFGSEEKSNSNSDLDLINKKIRWHRHVKNVSALKFKSNIISKIGEQLNNINDGYYSIPYQQDSFMWKKSNAAILYNKPVAVLDFFNHSRLKMTKTLSPRTIKNFSERNFKY